MRHVSITVPGTTDGTTPAPELQAKVAQEMAQTLTRRFGGATATPATGYYMAADGAIVEEPVIVIEAYVLGDDDPEPLAQTIADHIKRRMTQESVLYTIDRAPRFR